MGVKIEHFEGGQMRIVFDPTVTGVPERPEVVTVGGAKLLRSSRVGDQQPVLLNVPDPVARARLLSEISQPRI